ncbi:MAG: O-antigen ligase family protein [Deltaproteobacteria bacterium]|nr:O-antigen ligase family protein [Deltaproteobacteria bacterium]
MLLIILGISLLGIIQRPSLALKLFFATWPVWLLLLWYIATSQWASYPDISVRRSFAYITIYLIALSLAVSFEHPTDFQRPLYLGLAAIFLLNVLYYNGTSEGVSGIYAQKNGAGGIALYVVLVMTFSLALRQSLVTKLITLGLIVLAWIFLRSTQAKTSTGIAALFTFAVPVFAYLLSQPVRYRLVAGMILISFLATTLIALQVLHITLNDLATAIFVDLTFTNRTLIWNALIPEIWRHPWTGAGFGSFWATGQLFNPITNGTPDDFFMDAKLINEAHNGYIDITLQAGFVGLALAVFIIMRSAWQFCRAISISREDRDSRICCIIQFALVLAIALANLTESLVFQYSNPVGYLFLLIVVQGERWRLRDRETVPVTNF